jgi:formate hydrogenlyase subunit 6/NADH:ubiquinone oxidoreductase subunit I
MKQHFISASGLRELASKLLNDSTVIAPVKSFKNRYLEEITPSNLDKIDIFGFRTVESFKSFLFLLMEKVSKYFAKDSPAKEKNLIFLGMRGCDLEALEVLDRVFTEGDLTDPFYAANRKNVLIIGADCTDCGKTCFCTMVNGKPYPTKLYDITLSPIDGGYVAEAGSKNGERLISENSRLFTDASSGQLDQKKKNREKVIALLDETNKNYKLKRDISESHKRNLENKKLWSVLTKDCVECSACNFICPTCTCFLLLDQKNGKDGNERFKIWDACLKAGYQKVAGGANPRGKLFERLQNRYHCKFDYSFDRLNRYTCIGCGRCIDGCAGNIDMRKIFVELEKQAPLTAKLEML